MTIFSKMFGKYLLLTNTLSCGLMMAAGDIIQQHADFLKKHMSRKSAKSITCESTGPTHQSELNLSKAAPIVDAQIVSMTEFESEKQFDYTRMRNMTIVGFLQGPFHHYFYAALDKYLPGRCAMTIVKKTAIDQAVASPTCLGIFFFGLGAMERKNLQDINREIKIKLFETWKVDCMYWPPTQMINFFFVPMRYRVIYINFMTMIYDIFLSYMKYDVNPSNENSIANHRNKPNSRIVTALPANVV